MNLAETLLTALKAHGVQEIFGIPGDFALPFFKVIEESGILPLYTLSHEPGVGFAADAAARFHGRPSVVAVTYGAGALNMVNAIASAYAEKSPVVVISGAPGVQESRSGLLLHHQVKSLESQFNIYREITCDQVRLDNLRRAPEHLARVLHNCRSQSQPVYIELPRDMIGQPCQPVTPLTSPPADPAAISACVDEILARLERATAPVLLVGVEIRRYNLEDKVAQLARKLGLPVLTTFMGRGLLAETDAPLLGTYLGVAGDPHLTQLVENSDALVLLGVIFSDTNFGVSENQLDLRTSIRLREGAVSMGYHIYPNLSLAGVIDELLRRVEAWPSHSAIARPLYPRGLTADEQPIAPTDVAAAVNDLFDRHGRMPLASDMGDCLFTALDIENTELVAPGYYATMGFGVPAGLGVQVATGRRPLILVGDGAFQMTGWELGNCRRYGWNPIVLLFNNSSWEMLRAFQPESAFNNLDDWRFAEMAAGLGGMGQRVTTRRALREALEQAIAQPDRFHLIELMLPRGAMSNTLNRYVAGFQARRVRQQSAGG
ncbi:MAG: Indole-3-pyruvate decarboxylase [Anaerolineae bacterium]|nr:Indole-3-pyruvate decarboxylase [Anaerolineae bacterium]